MSTIINTINNINAEVMVKNIMICTAILGAVTMILMVAAGTICIMQYGWSSNEASTCGAIAVCAGLIMYFACNYICMH